MDTESLFNLYLQQICNYTVMFAVQKSYEQMERCLFYWVDIQALLADSSVCCQFCHGMYRALTHLIQISTIVMSGALME